MRGLIGVGLLGLAVGGCTSTMMSTTGKTMSAYTVTHLTPFVLGSPDTGMACAVSEANGNLLLSFERVESEVSGAVDAPASIATIRTKSSCVPSKPWATAASTTSATSSTSSALT